jgi:hypothetical protein
MSWGLNVQGRNMLNLIGMDFGGFLASYVNFRDLVKLQLLILPPRCCACLLGRFYNLIFRPLEIFFDLRFLKNKFCCWAE